MGRRAFAVAVVVGCASPAATHFQSYVSQTSGSADATQFELAPSGSGLAFAIAFPNSGDQMPSSLSSAGMELLAPPPGFGVTNTNCGDTAGIGVGIAGVVKAVAQSLDGSDLAGPPGNATFAVGPAIVQATIPWSAGYFCDGNNATVQQIMSGTSTITVFPSGRIVRADEMVVGTNNAAGPANCGCQDDNAVGNFQLSTFWGFTLGSADVDATGGTAGDAQALGCTLYPDLTLAVAFSDTQTHHDRNDFSAYVRDFQANGPSLDATPFAPYTSAMQIAPPAMCPDTVPLLANNPLILDGQPIGTDADGIYEVANPVAGELDFTSGSASIAPGFALLLGLGDHARIDIDGEATAFATQPGGSGQTVLYIAAGLDPGETLSVTPE